MVSKPSLIELVLGRIISHLILVLDSIRDSISGSRKNGLGYDNVANSKTRLKNAKNLEPH